MWPFLRGTWTYMEEEGNKKGRDKLKDKRTSHFHAKLDKRIETRYTACSYWGESDWFSTLGH